MVALHTRRRLVRVSTVAGGPGGRTRGAWPRSRARAVRVLTLSTNVCNESSIQHVHYVYILCSVYIFPLHITSSTIRSYIAPGPHPLQRLPPALVNPSRHLSPTVRVHGREQRDGGLGSRQRRQQRARQPREGDGRIREGETAGQGPSAASQPAYP